MLRLRHSQPRLEQLEDRCVPSVTVQSLAGSLTLKVAPRGMLTVTGAGGNMFTIKDGTSSLGTYSLTGNLTIQLTSEPDRVTIDLKGQRIGGNILIDAGTGLSVPSGTPEFLITSSTTAGSIGGSVTMIHGGAREDLEIGDSSGSAIPVIVGSYVSMTGQPSGLPVAPLSFALLPGSTIAGSLTVTNIATVNIGQQSSAGLSSIRGMLTVNDTTLPFGLNFNDFGSVSQTASINGTNYGDQVVIAAGAAPGSGLIDGNLTVALGAGNKLGPVANIVTVGSDDPTFPAPMLITGNANLSSVNGNAVFNLLGTTTVQGNLNLGLGQGNDTMVTGGTNLFPAVLTVGGNFTITGGNGNNNLGISDITNPGGPQFGLAANVGGNLSIQLGNGNNIAQVTGTVGGKVIWRSGNGNDSLTLGNNTDSILAAMMFGPPFGPTAQNYNLDAVFGNLDDFLTIDVGTGTVNGSANGGGAVTQNVFNQVSGNLGNFTLSNF